MSEFEFNLDKNIKEIEDNEYLRKTGFKELITTLVNLIFRKRISMDKTFDPLKNQTLNINFEMSDFSKELTEIELITGLKVEAYKKALILVSLKRLKNTSYIYNYKENDFYLSLKFNFLKTATNTYPIEIEIRLKDLPEDKNHQNELVEDFINTLPNNLTIPSEILSERDKRSSYIQSGHYIDMKLKHNYDESKKGLSVTKDIEDSSLATFVKEEKLVLGIRLSVAEDRLLNAILKLLHDKSDRTSGSENYFRGNLTPQVALYGGNMVDFPVLQFTPLELYKEYLGKSAYSGAEANHIKDTLEDLSKKNFLFIYKRHKVNEKGNHLIDRVEEYLPLIKIVKYYENITEEEDKKLDDNDLKTEEKGKIIVSLNHIFIDQIDTKFIEYPNDINKMTVIASGGARQVTESNIKIRDYFLREISSGHSSCEINEEKLPYILGLDKYIAQGRKKLINQRIKEAIEFSTNLKLIFDHEFITGVKGQNKIKFYLNTKF